MARHVRSTAEAAAPAPAEAAPEAADQTPAAERATFVNNYLNREFRFPDGTVHKFKHSRETYTDPVLIANLTALAADPIHQVFKQ